MPELPEVETIRRQLEPELAGRRDRRASEVLDARWTRPVPPADVEAAVKGRGIEGRTARQVPAGAARSRRDAGHAPADDRQPAAGRRGGGPTTAYLRARIRLDDGRELRFTDPRRFGEAFLLGPAALEERFARPPRRRAALRGVHRGGAGADRGRPQGAAEVVPARPGGGSPGSATSTPTRRSSAPGSTRSRRRARCATSTCRRCATGSWRRCRPGSTAAAPRSTTTVTLVASAARCRTSSSSTRREGEELPALRRDDPPDRRRRALDLLLPGVPGAAAAPAAAPAGAGGAGWLSVGPPPGGFAIGHWTDAEAATGCTVVIPPPGTRCGVDVRGGGPGTRETDVIGPLAGRARGERGAVDRAAAPSAWPPPTGSRAGGGAGTRPHDARRASCRSSPRR